jgi:hypothetical protein
MADEEIIAMSRKHWISIIPDIVPFMLYVVVSAVVVGLLQNPNVTLPDFSDPYYQLAIAGYVILSGYTVHKFFLHLINYFTCIVLITNFRVIEMKKTLFIQDTKESIDIKQIQNMEFQQEGLVENLLKFGSLNISLGNAEVKTLTQISNPDFHYRLINRLINEPYVRDHRALKNMEESTWIDQRVVNGPPRKG